MTERSLWAFLARLLTPRRLGYAWLAGSALWLAWLASISLGPGNFDLAGQAVGTDYLQFYAAGATLRNGNEAQLYNQDFQARLEIELAGPALTSYHAFITPPFFAWVFVPLSLLPYRLSFALWSMAGLFLLWASLKVLGAEAPFRSAAWALTWFPIFAAISFGQNSLLSLLILSSSYVLWRKEQRFSAGLVASLALYKPQLVAGVAILWLLEWRRDWKGLLGLAAGGLMLAGLSFGLLPGASQGYVEFSRTILPRLTEWGDFPLWHLHTLRGFWQILLPGMPLVVNILWILGSAVGVAAFVRLWQIRRHQPAPLYAAATCLMLWITPHAMIYDWTILLIPAVLLWQSVPERRRLWRSIFALLWGVAFFSGPLTYGQLQILPFALQLSVPVFCLALIQLYQTLIHPPSPIPSP